MAVEMAYVELQELDERGAASIVPYAEDDDVATQAMALPLRESLWIVRVTALDRRMMSTEQLLARLRAGALLKPGTLVWRGGMENWTPIARVHELAQAIGSASPGPRPATFRQAPIAQAEALRGVLAAIIVAVLAACVTASSLAMGGAFEPGARVERTSAGIGMRR
jgi:hypothetical protein